MKQTRIGAVTRFIGVGDLGRACGGNRRADSCGSAANRLISILAVAVFALASCSLSKSATRPWWERYGMASEAATRKPESVPNLIRALKDPDPKVRGEAVFALRQVGSAAEAAIPALVETLGDESEDVRAGVPGALAEHAPGVIPTLLTVLESDAAVVRAGTATTLWRIGRQASDAIPALLRHLDDPDADVRVQVMRALTSVAPAQKETFEGFVRNLSHPHARVRHSAVFGLFDIVDDNSEAVAFLIAALEGYQSEDDANRSSPERAVGDVLANDEFHGFWIIDGIKALAAAGSEHPDLREALTALLYSEAGRYPRHEIVRQLAKIRPVDPFTILHLVLLEADSDDLALRGTVVEALGSMGGEGALALPALLKMRDSPGNDQSLREAANAAAGQIASQLTGLAAEVTADLLGPEGEARRAAHRAMFKLMKGRTLPRLHKLLARDDPRVRRQVATSLGLLGLATPEVLRALERAAKRDPDEKVRRAAAESLRQLEQ